MRTLLCILTFSVCLKLSSAQQSWPPLGAIWYYQMSIHMSPGLTFMTISVTGDTIIKNKQCRKLTKSRHTSNCTDEEEFAFLYSDSGKVYWYNTVLDTFTTLYNFNAAVNDSWDILIDDCTLTVTVDSVDSAVINQDTLKVLFISANEQFGWDGTIIEGIGHTSYLLPSAYSWWCMGGACDMSYTHGLRCYDDSIIGHYESGLNPCDTIILSDETQIGLKNEIEIYPNPAVNYLQISGVKKECDFTIYTLSGKEILTRRLQNPETLVDVSNLAVGIYLYRIGEKQFGKIMIKRL